MGESKSRRTEPSIDVSTRTYTIFDRGACVYMVPMLTTPVVQVSTQIYVLGFEQQTHTWDQACSLVESGKFYWLLREAKLCLMERSYIPVKAERVLTTMEVLALTMVTPTRCGGKDYS